MRKAIWGSFFHKCSNDQEQLHDFSSMIEYHYFLLFWGFCPRWAKGRGVVGLCKNQALVTYFIDGFKNGIRWVYVFRDYINLSLTLVFGKC